MVDVHRRTTKLLRVLELSCVIGMSSSTIANGATQAITSALECFSNENVAVGDFPWSKDWVARLIDDNSSYDELKMGLQNIEAVEKQLKQMLASASDASRRLRENLIARANRGCFRDLPDEIIAIILEMALGEIRSKWSLRSAVDSYGMVSRQFRRVVVSMPVFWSKISSPPLGIEKATLFASRAVSPTICLSIKGVLMPEDLAYETSRVLSMYKFAVSISARIQKLALEFYNDDAPHLDQILNTCAMVSLPALSELRLDCQSNDVGRRVAPLCCCWDMPSLRNLILRDTLPELPIGALTRIRSCTLEANREDSPDELLMDGYWATSEIVEFLVSLTSVENLRVAVQLLGDYIRPEQDPVMQSVTSLNLGLQNTVVARSECVVHFIAFPSVASFRLELGLRDFRLLREVLNNLNFRLPPTSVTNVTVAVGMELEDIHDGGSSVYTIGEWCRQFGDIKSLRLESKRDKAHGLFAFASPFDALDVIDEEGSPMNGDAVEEIPFVMEWHRPHRKAIIDSDSTVKYVDERVFDIDPDFDY
ncbi:hypothetical protein SCHPADRAFT_1002469 [Schizopora paradoxa]|uniref:Uncharacterized protein n=1 Tax=Schizopora paradoxa TaxID=27342 RepID=A0A0H2R357_9AGAM|nr:hypothetical protein SCHPADRAFT_1002469 [Schizopora paradoxa]